MTNILVISDTHESSIKYLDLNLVEDIKNADIVLHAGDIGTEELYIELQNIAKKIFFVKGNNDFFELPKSCEIEIEGVRIGMTHGDGSMFMNIDNFLLNRFSVYSPDIIIHGHTHVPKNIMKLNTTILNPGSPTSNRGVNYNSYVKMNILNKEFTIDFIKIY